MSLLSNLFGNQILFQSFSVSEKRELLEIDHSSLNAEKIDRKGGIKVIQVDFSKENLIKKLQDEELDQLILIREYTRKADSTSGSSAINLYKKVLKLVPWDEISMMSIGVEYANSRNFGNAIKWLEKAFRENPSNQRVKNNLNGVKAAAR